MSQAMKIYSIKSISCFINNPSVFAFHADMFHGLAERDGKEFPFDSIVWAYTESPSPLKISRTFRNVPTLCSPSGNYVVDERLAERLQGVPNIRLQQVVFKRLVDIPYAKGDSWWEDGWTNPDPCKYLKSMPDIAEFHKKIGRYYEVQIWRVQDLIEQFEPCKDLEVEIETPPATKKAVIRISEHMMRQYPILWAEGCTFIADWVFHILDDEIDRDYFFVTEYEI